MDRRKAREEERIKRRDLKVEVLSHYGKNGRLRCCWRGCTVQHVDMLLLDHVKNNGYKNKGPCGKRRGGDGLYRYLKQRNFPAGHQTLCANHNLLKETLKRRGIK